MESIYWVISRDCNQECPHCYNDSGPGAAGLAPEQIGRCIASLPEPGDVPLDRIILSGGEVLVWPELLFRALAGLHARYGDAVKLVIQTNGDLLDGAMLDRLLAAHVFRVCVSSMDDYHPCEEPRLRRRDYLADLFRSRGMVEAEQHRSRSGWSGCCNKAPQGLRFLGSNPRNVDRPLVAARPGSGEQPFPGWPGPSVLRRLERGERLSSTYRGAAGLRGQHPACRRLSLLPDDVPADRVAARRVTHWHSRPLRHASGVSGAQ